MGARFWHKFPRWGAAACAAALFLTGCNLDIFSDADAPGTQPAVSVTGTPRPTSQESARLRQYLAEVERAQLSQGLLRKDGGGVDTPFTSAMLVQNFERIAFFNEYNGTFSGVGGRSPLRRWVKPIRIGIEFGDSVSETQRETDLKNVLAYANRLMRVTGHPVIFGGRPNFIVVIASEDDRAAALIDAARRMSNITASSLQGLHAMRRDTYCAVAAYATGSDANTYTAAVAVIRAENPPLLRLSCIHEELAQGMGLANDSPAARPSIFNDDDEFALLTRHDELLLRMLYDYRLRPGMNAWEAAPLMRVIAQELTQNEI